MTAPLEQIRVVELSRVGPSRHCTMVLADLGADVIKIAERTQPSADPRALATFTLDRNKRSVALNLKHEAGRQAFYRLANAADVVVEGFRPKVAQRLGVDYPTLSRSNPRLVYCSISGYGQDGPYWDLPGHDINYISQAGALGIMAGPEGPPFIPHNILADGGGGGYIGTIAILAALTARAHTGSGQYIDIAMTDGTMYLIEGLFEHYFRTGKLPYRGQTRLSGGVPEYNIYQTKDGKYLSLSCLEPNFYSNLCKVLGREDLIPRRSEGAVVSEAFREAFRSKTRDEWFELMRAEDICVAKVYSLDEVLKDPQVEHRGMIWEVATPQGEKVKQVAPPFKMDGMPGGPKRIAPWPGQDTDEVLAEVGYTGADIAQLHQQGAIA